MLYRIKRFTRHLRPKIVEEYFYEHHLDNIPLVKPKIEVKVFLLNENNIQRINEIKRLNIEYMISRLQNGSKCYVAEYEGKLISYHWVQSSGQHLVQQTSRYYSIKKDDAVVYHVRVKEEYRGNRINGYIYSRILKDCKSEGRRRVWIYTNKNNFANRKGLEKLGFVLHKKSLSIFFYKRFFLLNEKVVDFYIPKDE